MTPLKRLGTGEKRKSDSKYLDYFQRAIDKVLRFGSDRAFDWTIYNKYQESIRVYGER